MQRLQAFKYELKPNGEQRRNLRRYAGLCRLVYNKALALQQANHAAGEKFINYVAMAAWLPVWKREQGFAMPNKSSSISVTTAFSCPN
ncbi:helix-turn-helix domain-containing protein [Thiothrix fructosivorans]|uniref:Helix-turn-helix domain-containing protein n=1 Tax=Thiothrix fructosivorans TaxID=111770 RepID=A0A8B0SFI4_9GAMM|nr:helix-turn-helix domain-containing protein [Thiothrix fructosivorans]MBO0615140.1 helix-turn-helix domain-containing protein [Thiothrix fructosivorans]QTX09931.1 helix-turn-helix domain-containing protein [Thiothrix fructosivorans]